MSNQPPIDPDGLLVAVHEAGHAVVAHKLKADVVGIQLDHWPDGRSDAWRGFLYTKADTEPTARRRIAIAGPLAEARHLASVAMPGKQIEFDVAHPLTDFVRSSSYGPARIGLLADGQPFEQPVEFLPMDRDLWLVGEPSESDLTAAARDSCTLLNDPINWRAVNSLADSLIRQMHFERREIGSDLWRTLNAFYMKDRFGL